jgi:16S rRNA (cytosine967-C5)-methyltransferase
MPLTRAATSARRVAFRVVRRVFEEGAFADQALHAEAEQLDARDRAFARRLAFGTIQRRRTLDAVIARLAGKRRLDAPVRAALQVGLYQLLFMDGVADHAAVDETVELAKPTGGSTLVNAVLRRAVRERDALLDGLDEETLLSYPSWLAKLWRDAYGSETATALMTRLNEPPELALRANRLKTTPEELAEQLGEQAQPAGGDAIVIEGPFDAYAHPLWEAGQFMPQSRSSQAIAALLDPQPGERVLDLCAAPGGKTTHLAALMGNEGEIVSVERHPDRADALRRTCERMGVTIARIDVADAAAPRTDGPFDRVLADPPCSGLGTLQARPDLRWRMNPERIAGLIGEQRRILAAGAGALRPGGLMVWSTCTLDRAENEELLAEAPSLEALEHRILWPHETRSAGFEVTLIGSTG